ncbi:MAG: DUF3426 domain-containing protein [Halofilum sp. (in: g-proteobacteria)]|nr:DUF3426 domain-containing protein [Halofilum sp. (in: g-proteobacteria)]
MNTQCPHCRTVFRIGHDQLEAAGGRVRCSHCRRTFDARARLQKELPLESGPATATTRNHDQGELDLAAGRARGVAGVLLSDLDTGAAPAEGPGRGSLWLWGTVNLLLVVALCAQLLFAQRQAFAQDPTLRPLLVHMCDLAGCTLAPRRAVERIELVRRNVYAHPNVDDALIIDATFVNNARFAQPYPLLTISLGDIRGEALIRRNFTPGEYLPGLDPNARMAPGSPVRVSLEVRDPGREARTFEIDFG